MALTVQNIADAVACETRNFFGTTSVDLTDATNLALFTGWVDRIHKDVLHTSIWAAQMLTSETFESAPYVEGVSGSPYILAANNIRHVLTVHDIHNRRTIIPYHDLNFPAATSSPPERGGPPRTKWDQTQQTSATYPQYYIFEACILAEDGSITQGIHLLPDPYDSAHAGTIRYFYTKMIHTLDAAADILLVPEDGKDIMVAGVSMLAWEYIGYRPKSEAWRVLYESMKKGF